MLASLFLKIVNLSINASWLILVVIAVRLLIRKAPKWFNCLLWGLVAIRLLCPLSIESALSLLPSANVIPDNYVTESSPHIDSGVRIIDNAINPVIGSTLVPDEGAVINARLITFNVVATWIWIVGVAVMLLYAIGSFLLLKRKLRASVAIKDRAMVCDEVKSPFVLGIIRPVIYLPSGMADETLDMVMAHENAHLKRRDHLWKPLGFLLLSIYWFNPLCWVAYILLCRDIEAACDEKVIRDKDREYIAAYSQALLDCSTNRRMKAVCPLAFGETSVKDRVKGVLNYKKPAFWVIVLAVVACIVVTACFMTNPTDRTIDADLRSFLEDQVLDDDYSAYEDLGYEIFPTCDIEVLGKKADKNKITVYAWVLDQVYSNQNGELKEEAGSYIPTVFTVKAADEGYSLEEYWIPGDGSSYVPDIKGKFPINLRRDALDNTKYVDIQMNRNHKKALEYFKLLTEKKDKEASDREIEAHTADNDIGVYITAMDVKPTGCILFFTQKGGNVTGSLQTSQSYKLQKLDKAGKWSDLELNEDVGWEDIAYTLKTDSTTELDVNWEYTYGDQEEGHYRIIKTVMDFRASGDYDTYEISAEFDIVPNESKEDIQNFMKVDLPVRYWIGQYYDNIGWQGGNLILPRSYNNVISEYAPVEWRYSGLLSSIPAKSTGVIFDNGIPELSGIPADNHTETEDIDVIGLERSTDQWPIIMRKVEHDLATPAQIRELEDKGENLDGLEQTSSYWEFWFVKEGEDTYYVLTLSMKEFTEEEASRIALSVSIKK